MPNEMIGQASNKMAASKKTITVQPTQASREKKQYLQQVVGISADLAFSLCRHHVLSELSGYQFLLNPKSRESITFFQCASRSRIILSGVLKVNTSKMENWKFLRA